MGRYHSGRWGASVSEVTISTPYTITPYTRPVGVCWRFHLGGGMVVGPVDGQGELTGQGGGGGQGSTKSLAALAPLADKPKSHGQIMIEITYIFFNCCTESSRKGIRPR